MNILSICNTIIRTKTYQRVSNVLYDALCGYVKHRVLYTIDASFLVDSIPADYLSKIFHNINPSLSDKYVESVSNTDCNFDDNFHKFDTIDENEILWSVTTFNKTSIFLTVKNKKVLSKTRNVEENVNVSNLSVVNTSCNVRNLKLFCKHLMSVARENKKKTLFKNNIRLNSPGYFTTTRKRQIRDFSNVFINDSVIKQIDSIILSFKENKEFFIKNSIPIHTGILLYGPPGTGKSSVAQAICTEYSLVPIYIESMLLCTGTTLDILKNRISEISSLGATAAIVIEDIDSYEFMLKRDMNRVDKECAVNLSRWLNFIDGANCFDNVVWIMTTNRLELIDEAVYRPGRIDYTVNIPYVDSEAFDKYLMCIFKKHLPKNKVVKNNVSIAQVNVDARNLLTFEQIIDKYTELV